MSDLSVMMEIMIFFDDSDTGDLGGDHDDIKDNGDDDEDDNSNAWMTLTKTLKKISQ